MHSSWGPRSVAAAGVWVVAWLTPDDNPNCGLVLALVSIDLNDLVGVVGPLDLGEDVESLAGSPKIYFFKVASDAKI